MCNPGEESRKAVLQPLKALPASVGEDPFHALAVIEAILGGADLRLSWRELSDLIRALLLLKLSRSDPPF